MRLVRIARYRASALALALTLLSVPALAQGGGDPLAPPPDLGASGLPVPVDGTAIYGQGTPPPVGYMAIPAPPSTCAGIAAAVRTQGFILIPTGNGNAQRYVRDERSCADDQVTTPAWMATSDNPRCFVGYTCGEASNDGGN
ncbi:hypothetical protein V5F59_04670 [Xanthobacter autotrophicus DSM 431]|uniref:hypothetical protein n=1 Tax=Xanthobacter nonsaccharivorans TaxID=3119912 RepID=UPI0037267AAF